MNQFLNDEQRVKLGSYVEACQTELEMLDFVGRLDDDDFQLSAEEIEDTVEFFVGLNKGE